MRIFCAIEQEPFPGNRLWHNNIVDALSNLGHDVVLFNFPELDAFYRHADTTQPANQQWIQAHRPGLSHALLEQIRVEHQKKPLDVFLSYFYAAHTTPETIRAIHAFGIKTVNWYCNASYQFHLVAALATAFDVSLVPEKDRLDDYRRIGAHPVYCQEAANPRFYKDLKLARDLDVVFIGQRYATREALCYAVHASGSPIDVWGAGWGGPTADPAWKQMARRLKRWGQRVSGARVIPPAHAHGFVTDSEMVQIYNRAKIALGFGVVSAKDFQKRPRYQIRLRDFEAPMCGTFYLMEHQDEIQEFFKLGEEIETFHNGHELVDKVRFYLKHDDARERIRRAGYERAQRDHTWQKRLTACMELHP
jgi:spore maturation protein CgeB